jgi:hypothetical protein
MNINTVASGLTPRLRTLSQTVYRQVRILLQVPTYFVGHFSFCNGNIHRDSYRPPCGLWSNYTKLIN